VITYNLIKASNKFLTNFESTTEVELCKSINFSTSLKKILEVATSKKVTKCKCDIKKMRT